MVFRLLAVLAEFERDLISERTATAMAHLKTQGRRIGAVPLGFKEKDGRLVPVPEEQALIERLKGLHEGRGMSYQAIAQKLNSERIPSKNGRRWHPSTVFYVCAGSH